MLADAPNPTGKEFDPASLIRVINYLHSLGHRDAIESLDRFAKQFPNDGYESPHQCLRLVVPILFTRRDPQEKLPSENSEVLKILRDILGDDADFAESDETYLLTKDEWSGVHIRIENGIPFHTVRFGGYLGNPGNQSFLVDWARDRGILRADPLSPDDDPFLCSQSLLRKIGENNPDDITPKLMAHIRQQAFRSVSHLLTTEPRLSSYFDAITNWSEISEEYERLDIYWNAERQAYSSRQLQPILF